MTKKKEESIVHETIKDQIERQLKDKKKMLDIELSEATREITQTKENLEKVANDVQKELKRSEESILQKLLEKLKGSEDIAVRVLPDSVFKIDKRYQITLQGANASFEGTVYLQDANFLCLTDLKGYTLNIINKSLIAGAVVISLK